MKYSHAVKKLKNDIDIVRIINATRKAELIFKLFFSKS